MYCCFAHPLQAWVRGSIEARGMTDIMGPLTTAVDVLLRRPPSHPPSLPFIFLVTDGCVQVGCGLGVG